MEKRVGSVAFCYRWRPLTHLSSPIEWVLFINGDRDPSNEQADRGLETPRLPPRSIGFPIHGETLSANKGDRPSPEWTIQGSAGVRPNERA